ncbi:AbrB family transcriptional regulator [Stappia stellulata]|uniref:AbrB family transcriptional regulator n=1 Tax=Stappia stellulata TaxID=71235 RepID=UPI001CD6A5D7|nr:AbrB family transcriptional regulator [Stappia stellulata]MCA1243581.1 AbrB family transcriptional regulator [Stappia stellulata]
MPHAVPATLATLVVGALGGALFAWVGLPAAWLSGAMIAVALASLAKMPAHVPTPLRDGLFVVLGVTMGTGVTPDTIARIGEWPFTMALLGLTMIAVMGATYLYQRKVAGWDRETSYFAAIPGALAVVMAMTLSYPRADVGRVALAQSVRLFILMAVLPSLIAGSGAPVLDISAQPPAGPGLPVLAVLVALAGLIGFGTARAGVPAGWMTGPFFMSAILSATGTVDIILPGWLTHAALIGLGCVVGTRFSDFGAQALARMFVVCLGAFFVGMTISVGMSALVWAVFGLPFGQVLLAFAPGGLEVMTLLAFLLNLDPAFVAAHQIARYVAMVLILPFLTSRFLGTARPPAGPGSAV